MCILILLGLINYVILVHWHVMLQNYILEHKGENGIYYHNTSLTNGAGDNNYRYAGANPNNYICLGSMLQHVLMNLFRIIGVFGDKVKVIKDKSVEKNALGYLKL